MCSSDLRLSGGSGSGAFEEEISEQMAAMRAGLQGNAEGDEAAGKKKKGAAGVIETANPNAANASQKHKKASALDGSQPKVELTRREREEIEKQRAAAAYAKKHAEGKTEEAQRDMERLKEAKKRREEAAAKAKKVDADAERQKALADMEKSMTMKVDKGSFFEVAAEDIEKASGASSDRLRTLLEDIQSRVNAGASPEAAAAAVFSFAKDAAAFFSDAILANDASRFARAVSRSLQASCSRCTKASSSRRSEEHTSELQSP